jgi:hypothetical protein
MQPLPLQGAEFSGFWISEFSGHLLEDHHHNGQGRLTTASAMWRRLCAERVSPSVLQIYLFCALMI